MRLKISSRKSDLARIQAYLVGEALRQDHPSLEIDYRFRESLGDINQNDPLWKMPERGVFTDDFLADLIQGETDIVVHSWKDLPTEDRAETEIGGTLPRADARDVLILKRRAWPRVKESRSLRVFSSSPRRSHNLTPFFKEYLPTSIEHIEFISVRGNVPTRLKKLFEDDSVDALIVAKAAMDRLLAAGAQAGPESAHFSAVTQEIRTKLEHSLWMVLPLSAHPAAAAQGALAIEIKRGRSELVKLLAPIHCEKTSHSVQQEREILKSYGGGCHQKIGVTVLPRAYGAVTFLQGLCEDGTVLSRLELQRVPRELDVDLPFPREKCWPLPESCDRELVERRALPISSTQLESHALWIARNDALPPHFEPSEGQIVWAAGLETWKKLARRGIWVSGSAEGLGEAEDPQLFGLAGGKLNWLKLTHAQAESSEMRLLATYEVTAQKEFPDLTGKRACYWMSGSGFLRALDKNPELAAAHHFCGPGNTYQTLRSRLGPKASITIELNYAAWLNRNVSPRGPVHKALPERD